MATSTWIGAAADWSLPSYWSAGVPTASTNAIINAGSTVSVAGTAVANALPLLGGINLSGSLTLSSVLTLDGALQISGGSLTAQSITVDPNVSGNITGYGVINSPVTTSTGAGLEINSLGGILKFGSLSASQSSVFFNVYQNATLELSGSTFVYPGVAMYGSNATLMLYTPNLLAGPITGFSLSDRLILSNIIATSVTNDGTTLTINEGNGQTLHLAMPGSILALSTPQITSDGIGGSIITFGAQAIPTIALAVNESYTVGSPDLLIAGNSLGINTISYWESSSLFSISLSGSSTIVIDSSGTFGKDNLANIQRIHFSDTMVALDIGPTQTAGSVYMLYQATFNRTPDAAGLGYWINAVDKGANIIKDVAAAFVTSPEFIAKYGSNPTNASYVDNLYQNVLHRAGESGGVAYWNQQLNSGAATKAFVLEQFATLAEGAALVAPTIAHGIAYQQWVG